MKKYQELTGSRGDYVELAPTALFGSSAEAWHGGSIIGYGSLVLAALVAGVIIGRRNHASRSIIAAENDLVDLQSAEDLRFSPETLDYVETRFCPVCFAEYISGTATCEDCGVDLVEETEVPESTPQINEKLVRIPNVANAINAQLLRQYLFAYRIPSLLVRNSLADVLASDLYVFESDALRARKVIKQYLAETTRLKPV